MSSARAVAVCFLEELLSGSKLISALAGDSIFLSLNSADRRLATELVYGVLRNRERLDFYLASLSSRPLTSLNGTVLWILRLALYQIDYLRIPDHAVVHEAVELCRQLHRSSATSFVNAVLRSFLRQPPSLPQGKSSQALSVRFSHPHWLVKRYLDRFGIEQTEELLSRNNQPPVRFVRVNTFKTDLRTLCHKLEKEGISYEVFSALPHCLIVHSPAFTLHPLYLDGQCFAMDAGSQEIAHICNLDSYRVLGDFCCAPGGKSFIISSQMKAESNLFCCDSSWQRLEKTRERARLYGVPDLNLVRADMLESAPFKQRFDFVLLDAPCSGLGTLRSNPDIRWRVQEADLERFHSRQCRLLENSFAVLGSGGELVYSTCSTEPEENELVVEEFLKRESRAVLIGDFIRTFPGPHPGQGFFAARIRYS